MKIKYFLNISGIYFNFTLVGGAFPAVLHDLLEIGWRFRVLLRWRAKATALMAFPITREFLQACGCGEPVPRPCKHAQPVKSVQKASIEVELHLLPWLLLPHSSLIFSRKLVQIIKCHSESNASLYIMLQYSFIFQGLLTILMVLMFVTRTMLWRI